MTKKTLAVSAAALVLLSTALSSTPANAATTATGSCVDPGGRTWRAKVTWGSAYTDTSGTSRVHADYAGWTTAGEQVPTDSRVRTYDGSGVRIQQLQWSGVYDYRWSASWKVRNPLDPASAPGRSKIVVLLGVDHDGLGDCAVTFVQPPTTTNVPAPPPPTPAKPGPVNWDSTLAAVPLGSAGCSADGRSATTVALAKEWDYWDACGGSVVSAATEGLPKAPWGGDRVFRWRKPAGSADVYQKLNRTFTKDNWPAASAGPAVPNTGSPADVSGIYSVWQYIPSSRYKLNPGHGWVLPMEFKENYRDGTGNWHQDPLWGVGCNNFSGPITCSLSPHSSPSFALGSYTDRWVKWEFRVFQGAKDTTGHGGRIELWGDGKKLDTGYESQLHVGSAAFGPLSRTEAWVWIVGQYTSNQTTNGMPDYQGTDVTSYIGRSSVSPLP